MTEIKSQKVLMCMTRLLLPFTHGIDGFAIASALTLAQQCDATLVLLSLIHLPQAPGRGPRWEDIQQSRDFLEFGHHKATRSGVLVEQVELRTCNPVGSARALAQELECAGIVLAVRRGTGVLLATHEVKGLMEEQRLPVYVVALPGKDTIFSYSRWFRRR